MAHYGAVPQADEQSFQRAFLSLRDYLHVSISEIADGTDQSEIASALCYKIPVPHALHSSPDNRLHTSGHSQSLRRVASDASAVKAVP